VRVFAKKKLFKFLLINQDKLKEPTSKKQAQKMTFKLLFHIFNLFQLSSSNMLEEKDKYYAEILEKEVDFCHK
jgi:hypothetical protein